MNHTPTPWSVDPDCFLDVRGHDGLDVAIAITKEMNELVISAKTSGPATRAQAMANAAFIVKAVNAHDQLVEALILIRKIGARADETDEECAEKMAMYEKVDAALAMVQP
jgi:hypothetical protein